MFVYIYIYIYIKYIIHNEVIFISQRAPGPAKAAGTAARSLAATRATSSDRTPDLPAEIIPTKICRLIISGKFPCGHENSTP